MTALEDQREDAALGAAWRRCEAALPKGWMYAVELERYPPESRWTAEAWSNAGKDDPAYLETDGPTPTAALNALADRLETL